MVFVDDIEVDAVEHCNLKCTQCSHLSPHFTAKDSTYEYDQFCTDINHLAKNVRCNVFRFVGGEPLLNKNLREWAIAVRETHIANKLSIFTNGLLINDSTLSALEQFDDIRISVYNLNDDKFKKIINNVLWLKLQLPHKSIVANHIKTFLKFNLIEKNTNQELVEKIYKNCYHNKNSYTLFKNRLYRCFATRKKGKFLEKYKSMISDDYKEMLSPATDSIIITDSTTELQLNTFFNNQQPLEGCKWCLGCSGKRFENQQISDCSNEFATIKDIDFEAGNSYVSNCLLSWHMNRLEEVVDDRFFSKEFLNDFEKYHSKELHRTLE